jgi:toxin-antitoxin system PIN domain toxin
MKIVDLNLLLYAVNRDAPHHDAARDWWEGCLSAEEPIGIPWAVVLGFLRITTSGRVMPRPLAPEDALALVDDWLAQPMVRLPVPTERHWDILKQLISPHGTAGNLTTDAHLAALAVEHGAVLCSADRDFGRFELLTWENPLAG